MSLVLIVYLIGVIPNIAIGLNVIGVIGTILLVALAIGLKVDSNSTDCYSWDDLKLLKERRVRNGLWGDKCIKAAIFTLVLGLLSGLFPTKETMYLMLGAYGVEKMIENPIAQSLAGDGVDVLKQLMARAKKELAEDALKESK